MLTRRIFLVPAALLAGLVGAGPAMAATTIGQLAPLIDSGAVGCTSGSSPVLLASPAAPYVAPSAGIITSWSTNQFDGLGTAELVVLRNLSGTTAQVVATSESPSTDGGTRTTAARIPVHAGDFLGIASTSTTVILCGWSTGAPTGDPVVAGGDSPTPGTTYTFSESENGYRTNVTAVLEPDADGDGYGDESQDACPADAKIRTGPCAADLALTASAVDQRVVAKGLTAVVATVKNNGPSAATGVQVTTALPAGLSLVAAAAGGGDCTGTVTVTCTLGTVATGASARVVLVVRGTTTGTRAVTAMVSAAGTDPNSVDNTASTSVSVVAAGRLGERCFVPQLRGLTVKAAAKRLKQLGCAPGKVKRLKGARKGTKVTAQSVAPGAIKRKGTKVGLTLGKPTGRR